MKQQIFRDVSIRVFNQQRTCRPRNIFGFYDPRPCLGGPCPRQVRLACPGRPDERQLPAGPQWPGIDGCDGGLIARRYHEGCARVRWGLLQVEPQLPR
jgi:hypothetical protein